MDIGTLNGGPAREIPTIEPSEHPTELSMTHGRACPIWMWLSDGYVESAVEKGWESDERKSHHKERRR